MDTSVLSLLNRYLLLGPRGLSYVATYEDAKDTTSKFFVDVNWDEIKGYAEFAPIYYTRKAPPAI